MILFCVAGLRKFHQTVWVLLGGTDGIETERDNSILSSGHERDGQEWETPTQWSFENDFLTLKLSVVVLFCMVAGWWWMTHFSADAEEVPQSFQK